MPEPQTSNQPSPPDTPSTEEIQKWFSEGFKYNARCAVCRSLDRKRIEAAVAGGRGRRTAAAMFSVSEFSVGRHWKNHVSEKLKAARRVSVLMPGADFDTLKKETSPEGIVDRIKARLAALQWQFDQAFQRSDDRTMASLDAQMRKDEELLAKLHGMLVARSEHTTLSVEVTAEVTEMQRAIFIALAGYPEARQAVAAALHKLERDAAPLQPPRLIEGATKRRDAADAVPTS